MKKMIAGLALGTVLMTASCLGPNKAFEGLRDWNEELTDNRWVNELAFLGLNIIPVYPVFLFADYIVLNSIEWWSGDNPAD